MDKLIDLHTHSSYSDGNLEPNSLIVLAKEKGIGTLAITDHDTLKGNQNIDYQSEDISIIPGIELSAKVDRGRMHILGYGINIHDKELNNKMIELQNNSINSVLSLIEQIKKDYGLIFSSAEINGLITANHNIGRPDIAQLCVKKGYATSVQDAFNKHLIKAYSKTRKKNKGLSYVECIQLVLSSNGIPILAHPHTLELSEKELLLLIKEMIRNGLQGIEVYHSNHSNDETNLYLGIAHKFDLLISGGTDYHGPIVKPDIEIGTGRNNNVKIKRLSILEQLKNQS